MGVSKVYNLGLIAGAMGVHDLKEKKLAAIQCKTAEIAKAVKRRAANLYPSVRGKASFFILRNMHSKPDYVWNPTDRDWWVMQGWTKDIRPWKS